MTNEEQARAVGASQSLLRKRLGEARSVLCRETAKLFHPGRFDFEGQCLHSNNGKRRLQWRVRADLNLPESYENQQTNRGTVTLEVNRNAEA